MLSEIPIIETAGTSHNLDIKYKPLAKDSTRTVKNNLATKLSIAMNSFELIVSSVKSNNKNRFETNAILKIVRGNPENLYIESLLDINRKVLGCFSLKRKTIAVRANIWAKLAIHFKAALSIILVHYVVISLYACR